jgi:hypothetical protein
LLILKFAKGPATPLEGAVEVPPIVNAVPLCGVNVIAMFYSKNPLVYNDMRPEGGVLINNGMLSFEA